MGVSILFGLARSGSANLLKQIEQTTLSEKTLFAVRQVCKHIYEKKFKETLDILKSGGAVKSPISIIAREKRHHQTTLRISSHHIHTSSITAPTNHCVREAYHNTLIDLSYAEEENIWRGYDKNNKIQQAKLSHQIRETVRMIAWEYMKPEDVNRLKERNKALYGREEGPSFEYLIQKSLKKDPHADIIAILDDIIAGSERTSKDYDGQYGVEAPVIPLGGGDENTQENDQEEYTMNTPPKV